MYPCLPRRSIFSIARPLSYAVVLRRHLMPCLITGFVLGMAYYLPVDKIPFRVCIFFRITGYPCPTCGWTRGFFSMARGEWLTALRDCPIALFLYMVVVTIFLWNLAGIIFGVTIDRGPMLKLNLKKCVLAIIVIFAMITANWIYRLAMGFN